jgi:hypothetical protein
MDSYAYLLRFDSDNEDAAADLILLINHSAPYMVDNVNLHPVDLDPEGAPIR